MEESELKELIRKEKRKVFWRLYTLPWLSLTLFLTLLCVMLALKLRYTEKTVLNDVGEASGIETVDSREKIYEKVLEVKVDELWANESKMVFTVTNELNELSDRDILKRFQIEAVSNGVARWIVTTQGDTKFRWRTNLVDASKTIIITNIVDRNTREYPFMIGDMSIARDIGLDIEKELIRGINQVVEANTIGRNDERKKWEKELGKVVKNMFDGIETYKRGMK